MRLNETLKNCLLALASRYPKSLVDVYQDMPGQHGILVAETGLVVRRDWVRSELSVSATGLITIGLVLVKPPLWVDGLATVGVLAGVWWMYRPANRRAKPGTGKPTPGMAG